MIPTLFCLFRCTGPGLAGCEIKKWVDAVKSVVLLHMLTLASPPHINLPKLLCFASINLFPPVFQRVWFFHDCGWCRWRVAGCSHSWSVCFCVATPTPHQEEENHAQTPPRERGRIKKWLNRFTRWIWRQSGVKRCCFGRLFRQCLIWSLSYSWWNRWHQAARRQTRLCCVSWKSRNLRKSKCWVQGLLAQFTR